MPIRKELFLNILFLIINYNFAEETICAVNGKKSLNSVSDKFLSFTIDPVILLSGLNISGASMPLARHLSPSYVKISGPSTNYVKFSENDFTSELDKNDVVLSITPRMLESLKDWFITTNLTPIFGLNDKDRIDEDWNPRSVFPILEFSDRMNLTCLWQLGQDKPSRTYAQYKKDINSLNHMLRTFPKSNQFWKIVSGDFTHWFNSDSDLKLAMNEMENFTVAVTWDKSDEESFPKTDIMSKLLTTPTKPKISVWTTAPRTTHAITFACGLLWAKEIGEIAKMGYDVIFRQPRLYEFFADTPIYWITLFHKTLMGCNVLDVTTNQNFDTYVYAHCTKKQNSFSRRGAMTVFVVNNGTYEHTTVLKFNGFTSPIRNLEVQSYILTSDNEASTDTYMNGKILSMDMLNDDVFIIPKLRRARTTKHLTLSVPPKSVGFFVLPDARIPICINDEAEVALLMEEIRNDQNIDFSSERTEFSSRMGEKSIELNKPTTSLNELYSMMEAELEADEKYYREMSSNFGEKDWKKMLVEKFRETKTGKSVIPEDKINEVGKIFPNKMKILEQRKTDLAKKRSDINKKKEELALKLSEKTNFFKDKKYTKEKTTNLNEIIDITSDELEEIIIKTTNILRNDQGKLQKRFKRDVKLEKRDAKGGHRGSGVTKNRNRHRIRPKSKATKKKNKVQKSEADNTYKTQFKYKQKRDINMKMLREKTQADEKNHKSSHKLRFRPKSEDTFDYEEDFSDFSDSLENNESKFSKLNRKEKLESSERSNKPIVQPSFLNPKKVHHHSQKTKKPLHQLHEKHIDREFNQPKSHVIKNAQSIGGKKEVEGRHTNEDYVDEDDYENELCDYNDDDMTNYHAFHEKFADNVKIFNPRKQTEKELWEVDGYDRGIHDVNSFLEKEFVINKNDANIIKQTIKNLENFFNKPQDSNKYHDMNLSVEDDYDDIDYLDYRKQPTRTKREERQHYTEDDVRQYRQLMNTNIRHMKDNIRKQKAKYKLRKDPSPMVQKVNKDSIPKPILPPRLAQTDNNAEGVRSIFKKNDVARTKTNFDEVKMGKNIKFLKSRLAQHKFKENLQNGRGNLVRADNKQFVEVDDETKELIKRVKNELRNRKQRSLNEEYVPTTESIHIDRKRYESVARNRDEWKMEDILKFSSKNINFFIDKNDVLNRQERHIDEDVGSYGNDIEDFFNAIKKDTGYLIPELERNEFSLVLPTRDEISFSNVDGDTEIKFKHHMTSENPTDEGTCPLETSTFQGNADQVTSSFVENSNKIAVSAELTDDATITSEVFKLNDSDSSGGDECDLQSRRSEASKHVHVQKISKKCKSNNIVDKIFDAVSNFMNDVYEKVNKYVRYIQG